ncbi:MAG: hypothetical protein A2X86_14935 [Bdellovibrionales bacterium GWA2_49_15]|nr:MAG: hypothetical protein A2X86_14935 [Bdellovibrionales bacterium GWA2_49_15]HAZ13362.1 hypothetical protein [Bdellovibrionales bacterium]
MKTLFAFVALVFLATANASQLPDTAFLPAVLVKDITQRGNLMPGPGPRRAVVTTVEVDVKFCRNVGEREFDVVVEKNDLQNVTLTISPKTYMLDCFGPARLQTLVFETTQVPAYVNVRLGNSLLIETNFVH